MQANGDRPDLHDKIVYKVYNNEVLLIPIMILQTKRLIIRPVTMDDKHAVFKYRSDSETNKYQEWIPETIKDVEEFIGKISKQIDLPETWFQFVIIKKETKEIIGDSGIYFSDKDNKQVELGCTLDRHHQKKGYAAEALVKLINYIFHELNKHRITASIDPDNINSIRLFERIGFRKEAHFIESLLINGKWADNLIYALLKKEWNSKT